MASPGLSRGWRPIAVWQLLAVAAFGVLVIVLGNSGDYWIPILDSVNLVFHEAGHPIFGLLDGRLGVYGGTLGQLLLPLLLAVSFRRRREAVSTSLATIWLFQNFFNVARYMGDARSRVLPLIGGDHDWTEIFSRWQVLHLDTRIAGLVSLLGFLGVLLAWGALAWIWWLQKAEERCIGSRAGSTGKPSGKS